MEREKIPKDVFISYRRVCPDREWVQKDLSDALKRAGLEVWLDVRDGGPARNIYNETEEVIRECRWAICVTSPIYMKETRKRDGLVSFEFRKLLELNNPDGHPCLIPLLLGSGTVPERIDSLAAINWANPAIRLQEWERLLNALQAKNPKASAPRALRFYFVKLYLCLFIAFLRSHLVLIIVAACLALLVGAALFVEPTPEPLPQAKIEITQIPPAGGGPDSFVQIDGRVTGGNPRELQVVIYSYAQKKWYVQPFDYAPFTNIDSKGGWTAQIHPGTIYAALLVKHSFTPTPVINNSNSPASLGGGVVDVQIVHAGSSSLAP